ncbi:uncharacterized protein PFL1_06825 [Pseudozyma flocculosa PF-1]|nr:uncharacterized protein PFL1_06825 [Pseudozyma flocculosa PF-1]EPQ25610.1 hypothetical protein PFL1_06825 [Pseudozyma flocculosa PF-1]
MRGFLEDPSVIQIRNYCSNKFAACFPDHAALYSYVGNADLYRKHKAFLWPPFSSLAINEEKMSISQPHRDTQDLLQGLAGVFSFGQYKMTTLNFKEAKASVEMPPGALCFLPSHVLTHFNTAIEEGETRGSLTMFLGHDVVRWIKYGGKAGEASKEVIKKAREEFMEWWNMFKKVEEKGL